MAVRSVLALVEITQLCACGDTYRNAHTPDTYPDTNIATREFSFAPNQGVVAERLKRILLRGLKAVLPKWEVRPVSRVPHSRSHDNCVVCGQTLKVMSHVVAQAAFIDLRRISRWLQKKN